MLLALAVVFVMLGTTGWTAVRGHRGAATPIAASLAAWERGHIGGHRLPDPDRTTPIRLAQFFASLDTRQRARLAARYPLAVGNMNGAPVALRYRANRIALGQARKVEIARMHDKRLSAVGQRDAGRRMHRYEALMAGKRRILAFDPMGSGRVAEVFGDLGRAERVSVVVPGVDTDLLTFQRTERQYTAPVGMAKALYRAEREAAPGRVRPSSRGPTTRHRTGSAWTPPPGPAPRREPSGSPPSSGPCPAAPASRCTATATDPWSAGWPPTHCRRASPT